MLLLLFLHGAVCASKQHTLGFLDLSSSQRLPPASLLATRYYRSTQKLSGGEIAKICLMLRFFKKMSARM